MGPHTRFRDDLDPTDLEPKGGVLGVGKFVHNHLAPCEWPTFDVVEFVPPGRFRIRRRGEERLVLGANVMLRQPGEPDIWRFQFIKIDDRLRLLMYRVGTAKKITC